jgi:hypothetical protein
MSRTNVQIGQTGLNEFVLCEKADVGSDEDLASRVTPIYGL